MNDRNLWRGLFLSAIALAFGGTAWRYPTGDLAHIGPGLFPLIVSGLLLVVGLAMTVRCFLTDEKQALEFKLRNIGLILGSLCGFAAISHFVNMIAGIVFLVFFSGLAAGSYSWKRSLVISAALTGIALVFRSLLGLNLPLY